MKDWLRCECAETGRAERTAGTRARRLEYTGPGCHAGSRRGEMESEICTMGQGILGKALMMIMMIMMRGRRRRGEEGEGEEEEEERSSCLVVVHNHNDKVSILILPCLNTHIILAP